MAWSTPPTFSDAAILSAAQLNILSDDCEHLYGLVQAINVPLAAGGSPWVIRHKFRYLHFSVEGEGMNNFTNLRIFWNGTQIYLNAGTFVYPNLIASAYVDLNAAMPGLAFGAIGKLTHSAEPDNPFGNMLMRYLQESDQTTI